MTNNNVEISGVFKWYHDMRKMCKNRIKIKKIGRYTNVLICMNIKIWE